MSIISIKQLKYIFSQRLKWFNILNSKIVLYFNKKYHEKVILASKDNSKSPA